MELVPDPDPDLHQNDTDPKHCLDGLHDIKWLASAVMWSNMGNMLIVNDWLNIWMHDLPWLEDWNIADKLAEESILF